MEVRKTVKLVIVIFNMSDEERKEFDEMREFFRKVKYGSKFVIAFFSLCMAVGGAYLMVKSIATK